MSFFTSLLKKVLPSSYINELKRRYHVPDMEWSLKNLYANGFRPRGIVDIGAYEGEWTRMTKLIFKESKFLMLEAQESKTKILNSMKSADIDVEIALLGPSSNQNVKFYINETVSSALPETEKSKQDFVELKMFSLDDVLEKKNFENPDFLKLDVQGFELEVLKGATKALTQAEVVLMEVSLIEINKGAPLLSDIIAFMSQHAYVCYDICSLVRRPLDNALWQTDLIFVKQNSKLVQSKRYE
jgi:FkbM family methyltransferase